MKPYSGAFAVRAIVSRIGVVEEPIHRRSIAVGCKGQAMAGVGVEICFCHLFAACQLAVSRPETAMPDRLTDGRACRCRFTEERLEVLVT